MAVLLALDEAGAQVVANWLDSPQAAPDLVERVHQLLDDLQWRRPLGDRYHKPDLMVPGDRLVWITSDWVVVVRMYSDDDPERLFSVVRILQRELPPGALPP